MRGGDAGPLVAVAVGCTCCVTAAGVLQSLFVRLSAGLGQGVVAELRVRLFAHLQAQSVAFHDAHASGTLASRASGDVAAVHGLFRSGLDQIVTAAVSLVYIASALLVLDPPLGLAALAALVPVCWTMRSFRRRSLPVYHRRSTAAGAVAGDLRETFAGIRTVRAFGREDVNERRFAGLDRCHRDANERAELEMARYVTASRLVANAAVAGLVLWGGYRVAGGTLEMGAYAGVVLYLRDLYDKPLRLGGVLDAYQAAAASLGKIAVLLAVPPAVAEPARPVPLPRRARGPVRERLLRLRRRARRPARLRPDACGGPDRRAGGALGRRQVHPGQAAGPLPRPHRGPGPPRRRRPARPVERRSAPRRGHGPPGELPLLRHRRREHRPGPPRRHPRRDPAGRRGDRRPPVRLRPPGRLRDRRREPLLGGPAPTHRADPGVPPRPVGHRAGRGHRGPRPSGRACRARGDACGVRGADGPRRRPPAVHAPHRRPGPGPGRRPCRPGLRPGGPGGAHASGVVSPRLSGSRSSGSRPG
ncbi:ABC transporter ATP-binding protein [Streptomyces sp. ST1015]|nr:ABC transporter ATP-binding protein [Streptomyces sp. ST1015]